MIGPEKSVGCSINFSSPAFASDPFSIYKDLRKYFPVFHDQDLGCFVVSRYDDVYFALTHPEIFGEGASSVTQPDWLARDCQHKVFLITEDPPGHSKTRVAINPSFAPPSISLLVPAMQAQAEQLLYKLNQQAQFDFVGEFSFPYVWSVIEQLFGLQRYGRSCKDIWRWIALFNTITPNRPGQAYIDELEAGIRELFKYLCENIDSHRNNPQHDGLSHLLNMRINDQALTEEEVRNALVLFASAGLESTAQLLSASVVHLLSHRDTLDHLLEYPEHIPKFIEEMLRFSGPTHALLRKTRVPVDIGGVTIPEGSLVKLVIASANRDESKFPNPDEFNMERDNIKRQIAFGAGPHFCVGAPLARLELRTAFETLLPALRHFECPPAHTLDWHMSVVTRSLVALPIHRV